MKTANGLTALSLAASQGDQRSVELLLRAEVLNADDPAGWYALITAAQKSHVTIVRLLLEAGAPFNHVNSSGASALSVASGAGQLEVVSLLLSEAFDAPTYADIESARLAAKRRDHQHVARILERTAYDLWLGQRCRGPGGEMRMRLNTGYTRVRQAEEALSLMGFRPAPVDGFLDDEFESALGAYRQHIGRPEGGGSREAAIDEILNSFAEELRTYRYDRVAGVVLLATPDSVTLGEKSVGSGWSSVYNLTPATVNGIHPSRPAPQDLIGSCLGAIVNPASGDVLYMSRSEGVLLRGFRQ